MGTVTGIRGETYIQPRTFRSASFQQFRLISNHRLIGTLTNRKARLSNLEFLTRSEAKLVSVSTLTRRVCDRRPLINCLRALEARMDPSTEKWSFNSEMPPAEEDFALSA